DGPVEVPRDPEGGPQVVVGGGVPRVGGGCRLVPPHHCRLVPPPHRLLPLVERERDTQHHQPHRLQLRLPLFLALPLVRRLLRWTVPIRTLALRTHARRLVLTRQPLVPAALAAPTPELYLLRHHPEYIPVSNTRQVFPY